jgi:hypothetical protein
MCVHAITFAISVAAAAWFADNNDLPTNIGREPAPDDLARSGWDHNKGAPV